MKRRDFFKGAGISAAIAALSGAGISIAPGCADSQNSVKSRDYKSGEMIEVLPVPVEIDGWGVYINKESLREYSGKNAESSLEFSLIGRAMSDFPSIRTGFGVFSTSYTNSVEREGKNYWKMEGMPFSYEFTDVFLIFAQREKGELTSSVAFPLNFEVFTYKEKEDDLPKIYSEIPLEEMLLKELHEQHKVFDKFTAPYGVFILKSEKLAGMNDEDLEERMRGGYCNYDDSRIYLPSIIFTNPRFPNEGRMKMYHELAHVIMNSVINDDRDQRVNIALFSAYAELVKAAGYDIPMPTFSMFGPPDEIENNPCFSIFDESSYLKGVAEQRFIQGYGHPYNSHNETFASALAVFRFFPDEFARRYEKLGGNVKKAVRNAANAVLNVVEAMNPDENALQTLLPEYRTLKTALKQYI